MRVIVNPLFWSFVLFSGIVLTVLVFHISITSNITSHTLAKAGFSGALSHDRSHGMGRGSETDKFVGDMDSYRTFNKQGRVNNVIERLSLQKTHAPIDNNVLSKHKFDRTEMTNRHGPHFKRPNAIKAESVGDSEDKHLTIFNDKMQTVNNDRKLILLFTTLFEKSEWPNLKTRDAADFLDKTRCPVANCEISYNPHRLAHSDVVIFHGRDTFKGMIFDDLINKRPKHQVWVYFTSESPMMSDDLPYFSNIINWTMTYRHNSDIWLPYFKAVELDPNDPRSNKNENYADGKTGLVAWVVSNCGRIRDTVAHQLEAFIDVDVAGDCAHEFKRHFHCPGAPTIEDKECDFNLRKYKFYLAFESEFCDEYVSEKYWYRAIRNGVVPVVLGGGPYSDPRVAIPGSYISVEDFDTIKELADHLKYLDKNDKAYNEYFAWKQKYKLWKPLYGDWPWEYYFLCEACKKINNKDLKPQVYQSLSWFWNAHDQCHGKQKNVEEILAKTEKQYEHELALLDWRYRVRKPGSDTRAEDPDTDWNPDGDSSPAESNRGHENAEDKYVETNLGQKSKKRGHLDDDSEDEQMEYLLLTAIFLSILALVLYSGHYIFQLW